MPSVPAPRSRGPKAVKMDAQALLDAAQAVFAREGIQGASLRAIARQAGCDPALIYYHFANKEAMFAALLAERMPPVVERLDQLALPQDTRSTAAKLWAVLGILHEHFHASAGFRAMVRGEITKGAPGIQELLVTHLSPAQKAIGSILEEGLCQGSLRPGLNPCFLAFFLVRMEFELLDRVPALAVAMADLPQDQALSLAEEAWFDVFWRGIAARPGAPFPLDGPP